jgi:NAD(P)-dependent dehydrogenase (short-subunit alcohol dehydrogenase family)
MSAAVLAERGRGMEDLLGKVVLVTGAARGMGKSHALAFAREGARVVITDIDRKELEKAEAEIRTAGHEVHAYVLDISIREDCFALAARVEAEAGPVDVLINNAAVAVPGTVLETSESVYRRTTEVNYLGQVWMMQAFVPSMVKRASGHVVNICSGAGKAAPPYIGPYSATKFAMVGLTDAVRQELKGTGVGFSIVNPGYISTGMFEGSKPMTATRWLKPQKVSDAVVRAVRKGKCEVFIPPEVWLTSFGRGLGMPRFADFLMTVFGGRRSFEKMREDRGRPF